MRKLNVAASSTSSEGYQNTSERLVNEMGEPIKRKVSGIVAAEEGALEKLKGLQSVR